MLRRFSWLLPPMHRQVRKQRIQAKGRGRRGSADRGKQQVRFQVWRGIFTAVDLCQAWRR